MAFMRPGSSKRVKTDANSVHCEIPTVEQDDTPATATSLHPEPAAEDTSASDLKAFLRSWAWKREHRPDRDRFHRPYLHKLNVDGKPDPITLRIKQQQFKASGFASTVWDSSIVVAKYIEKCADSYRGKKCLDLSAGCGLVGIVLSTVGAVVTCSDLPGNLDLLQENCSTNGAADVRVVAHVWGEEADTLGGPFDAIFACDVMYIDEAVPSLCSSLVALTTRGSQVVAAHGRNRGAEAKFLATMEKHFTCDEISSKDLDSVYQCSDVSVWKFVRKSDMGE